jgi:F-box-like
MPDTQHPDSQNNNNINNVSLTDFLPDEILAKIFSNLFNIDSYLASNRVDKRWRQIASDFSLTEIQEFFGKQRRNLFGTSLNFYTHFNVNNNNGWHTMFGGAYPKKVWKFFILVQKYAPEHLRDFQKFLVANNLDLGKEIDGKNILYWAIAKNMPLKIIQAIVVCGEQLVEGEFENYLDNLLNSKTIDNDELIQFLCDSFYNLLRNSEIEEFGWGQPAFQNLFQKLIVLNLIQMLVYLCIMLQPTIMIILYLIAYLNKAISQHGIFKILRAKRHSISRLRILKEKFNIAKLKDF